MIELKKYSFADQSSDGQRTRLHEVARKHWVKTLLQIVIALAGFTASASAQFIGYNAAQSTSQNLFTNQAANAISRTITNLGQSSHFFTVCNVGFQGTVIIQSSQNGTFSPPNTIASANYGFASGAQPPPPPDSNCHLIQAGGYYPTMRVQITNYGAGNTSVFYSGIGSPIAFAPAAFSTIGPTSPIACDQHSSNPIPATVAFATLVAGLPNQVIIVCSITMSFDANTGSGGLLVFGTDSTASGLPASCTTLAPFISQIHTFTDTTNPIHLLGGAGGLFRVSKSLPLCISTSAVGANTQVEVSFAQITF